MHNVLRNILIATSVFLLGMVVVVRRSHLAQYVPTDTPTLTADAAAGERAPDLTKVIERPDTAQGAGIFKQKGCSACHRIGGRGPMGIGPDLSKIGGTPYDGLPNTPEFLAKWLENPQAQKPSTMMPRLPLTPTERDALVRYLTSLK
jgi:cytochrome c2